jgi:hypothetical protein
MTVTAAAGLSVQQRSQKKHNTLGSTASHARAGSGHYRQPGPALLDSLLAHTPRCVCACPPACTHYLNASSCQAPCHLLGRHQVHQLGATGIGGGRSQQEEGEEEEEQEQGI